MLSKDKAENAARLLSLHKYRGYSCWGVELTYWKTFEEGQAYEQRGILDVVAVQQSISHLRLPEEEATSVLTTLRQEQS